MTNTTTLWHTYARFLNLDLRDFDADGLWDAGDEPGARDGGLADALQLVQLGRDDLRLRRSHRMRRCELSRSDHVDVYSNWIIVVDFEFDTSHLQEKGHEHARIIQSSFLKTSRKEPNIF